MSYDLEIENELTTQVQQVNDVNGNGSALYLGLNNVGINVSGTPTLNYPLQVTGGIASNLVHTWSLEYYFFVEPDFPTEGSVGIGVYNAQTKSMSNDLMIDAQGIFLQTRSGGNVGIGTLTPQSTLDVNGTIQAKGLNVTGPLSIPNLVLTNLTVPPSGTKVHHLAVDQQGNIYLETPFE